jgi:peptidoglycan/LPS O-acetylase OafA/YrhL
VVGVVVFFALSGYLITGILVGDVQRFGRVRYGRFYRNRVLRLVPPLLALLIGFTIVTLVLSPIDGDEQQVLTSWAGALTYTMDLPYVPHGSPSLSHLWTLSVEEQFYILWPLVLLVALRWGRVGAAAVLSGVAIWAACAASLAWVAPDYHRVYTWPTSWAVVMAMGGAAWIYQDRIAATLRTQHRRSLAAAVSFGILLALAFVPDAKQWPGTYLLLGPLIGAATLGLVFFARELTTLDRGPGRWLVLLGTISYAAYLWNYALVRWFSPTKDATGLVPVITLTLTIALATASWLLVERPVMRWRTARDGRLREERSEPTAADSPV